MDARLREWKWVAAYTLLLCGLSVLRYRLWLSPGVDLGHFEQGLWLLTHGGIRAVSTYYGVPILADTASYILLLVAPLYQLGGVYMLFLLQAFALALGYPLIHSIGRALEMDEGSTRLVGFMYLAYPTVVASNFFGFYPDALGIPILFGLVWAVIKERWSIYALLLVASVMVKDTVPVLLLGLGAALAVMGRIGWGAVTVFTGLLAGYLDVAVVIPALARRPMMQWSQLYGHLGGTPLHGVLYLMSHPLALIGWVDRFDAWACLFFLFGPFVIVLVILGARTLNPWWLPGLALCEQYLLAGRPFSSNPFNEDYLMAVPFFFSAVLIGLSRLRIAGRGTARRFLLLPVLLLLATYMAIEYVFLANSPAPNAAAMEAAIAAVPRDAPVMAQNLVITHVPPRPRMWVTTVLRRGVDLPAGTYVILDPSMTTLELPPPVLRRLHAILTTNGQADLVFSRDTVAVYRLRRPLSLLPEDGSSPLPRLPRDNG